MRDNAWLNRFYFTQFINKLLNPTKEGLIKSFLVLLFAAGFFPIVYQLFFFIFKHFYSVPFIGGLLVSKLLYTFFLTFSVMIILSSVVSAIPILYLSRDMDFLFSSPIKVESVFASQALKIIAGASWMILLMSLPIFAAYAKVLKIGLDQYLFIIIAHVPFFIILACIGIVLTIVLVRYFPAENVRNIALALSGIFVVIFVIYFRMLQPEKLSGSSFVEVNSFIQNLRTPESPWLPHTQFVRLIEKISASGIYAGIGPFLYFLSASFIILALVLKASGSLYFEGYGRKGAYIKQKPLAEAYEYKKKLKFLSQMDKDFKYLVRDTSQWIQLVFLTGIVFIYLFNLYKLPSELYGLKDFIFFLNIGFIGMVLSAVGARFVLPVISTEGKGFWIFKTAPMSMEQFVMYKFIVYSLPLVITGQIVAFISVSMLKPGAFIDILTFFSTFFITIVISSVGIGFGAYFANFNIKNPEDLITGVAGLAYMFVSFLFVALVLFIEAGIVKDYYMSRLVKAYAFKPWSYTVNFLLIFLAAIIISSAAIWAGIRKLKRMEI